MSTPRRWSDLSPIGIDLDGLRVDGLLYHQVKQRLALIEPPTPGETSRAQREFAGAEPVVADLARPRLGGWVQPEQVSAWTKADDLDEYDSAPSIPMWLRPTTVAELEGTS